MAWWMLVLACAPRWWAPSPWEGDEILATGVICQGEALRPDSEYWVRVAVRYAEDVEVDWQSAELGVVNAEVIRRELGPVRLAGSRTYMRYDTWYLQPLEPVPGEEAGGAEGPGADEPVDVAALGPYRMSWRPPGHEDWETWEAHGCTARLP